MLPTAAIARFFVTGNSLNIVMLGYCRLGYCYYNIARNRHHQREYCRFIWTIVTTQCKYVRFRLSETPSEQIPFGARSVGHHTVPAGWVDNVFVVQHVALYWGIGGRGGLDFKDEKQTIGPGQIGIYPPGMTQIIYALDEPWEYCWWTMDGPMAEQIVRAFGFTAGVHEAGPAPLNFFNALDAMIQGAGHRNEINASALAYQLLCVAAQHHGTDSETHKHTQLIEHATDMILASWQDPDFNVGRLADRLSIHRSTLSRRFHAATGTRLGDYITAVRLQNAGAMLRETSLSVAEISMQCGYADPNYFSKLMKHKLGMPPSDFRKTLGGELTGAHNTHRFSRLKAEQHTFLCPGQDGAVLRE